MINAEIDSSPPLAANPAAYSLGLDRVLPAVVLAVIIAFVYAPGINGWYFLDDFQFYFATPSEHLWQNFFRPHPSLPAFWRPLQSSLLALQQLTFSDATWPCHALACAMHAMVALLVYAAVRDLNGTRQQAWLGAIFTAAAQIAVEAVAGVDTISQVGATLGVAVAAWAMLRSTRGARCLPSLRSGWYWLAVSAMLFGLLWKETAAGGPAILAIVLLIARRAETGLRRRRILPLLVVIAAVFAGYYLWRAAIVTATPGGPRYGMALQHLPRNAAALFGAVVLEFSPHKLWVWRHAGGTVWLAAAGLGTVLLLALAMAGLRRTPWSTTGGIVAVAVLAMAPVLPLAHVSELYSYGALPILAVLVGMGLGTLFGRARRPLALARYGTVALLLIVQALAARGKVQTMASNGEQSRELFRQVVAIAKDAPPAARIWLTEPPLQQPQYSVLLADGVKLIWSACDVIPARVGRDDIRVSIVAHSSMAPPDGRLYVLQGGRLAQVNEGS